MSLTRCDRVARCEESCNHTGPCSFNEPLERLVSAIEQWVSDPSLQERASLEFWTREEVRAAREHLGEAR
jgi:hypothetical protein